MRPNLSARNCHGRLAQVVLNERARLGAVPFGRAGVGADNPPDPEASNSSLLQRTCPSYDELKPNRSILCDELLGKPYRESEVFHQRARFMG